MNNHAAHILVVDDDPDISMMLKLMLEFKGHSVKTAERTEETRQVLSGNKIDLIIMDMLLSGVNGTDICTELKANQATNSIPIIMISAHPNAKELCMQAGADDFIAKPFDMDEMLDAIKKLVNKT